MATKQAEKIMKQIEKMRDSRLFNNNGKLSMAVIRFVITLRDKDGLIERNPVDLYGRPLKMLGERNSMIAMQVSEVLDIKPETDADFIKFTKPQVKKIIRWFGIVVRK